MATFGSTSETSTELRKYTRDLYLRLESETGLATGMRQVGLIELAIEPGRLEEYRRVAAFNRHCGVEVHEISAKEVADLWPLARTDDVLAGFYIPADGRVNPVDVTMSLAKGARQQGVRIIEGIAVTGFIAAAGTVTGVRTDKGDIEAEYVVNCAGSAVFPAGRVRTAKSRALAFPLLLPEMAQRLNHEGLFAFEPCHHFWPRTPEINASTADLDFLRGTVRQITDLGRHLRREAKEIGSPGSLRHDCPTLPSRNCSGRLVDVGT